ncbi:protein RodZ, contains Xre-like HTH and DUF4115 domains [Tranquillimonas rosea]|uniref:Protein RodZ, contains Xre-like HTH and DUF4115 domains n=1 Tax=Tranquillimonas rosea TaxID=641238 RepID=A0A1H9TBJ7_9RHOB|nr:helix-turn-helix domain-containing protein [Tranquillimonas rosea]SER94625.1 protein RodZ, contains Xre-like HTH and DUF4115 domains [Tranquillimonas rosea]
MIGRFKTPAAEEDERPKGFDDFDLRLGDVMRGERATLGKSLLDVQRELKIRATYIAAIENADPSAFETPGFIAGYVRSYSRYLGLDAEWAWRAFCREGNFETAHGMSQAASIKQSRPEPAQSAAHSPKKRDPFLEPSISYTPPGQRMLSGIEPGAIGSVAVMIALIGLIGYGGFAVLKEVQKVQFVPVEQSPGVASDIDPLAGAAPQQPEGEETEVAGLNADADEGEMFDRLYRPQALDVPVMTPRDGPIAALDPSSVGALSDASERRRLAAASSSLAQQTGPAPDRQDIAAATPDMLTDGTLNQDGGVQVVEDTPPQVVMLAVRPSWVRVRSADGSVIYERIMEPGDRFELPRTEEPATLRTGESGAIYFAVNGQTYGPAGQSGQVTSDLSLAAASLTDTYSVADLGSDSDLQTYVAELELGTGDDADAPSE